MKVTMQIQASENSNVGIAASSVQIPYDAELDVRNVIASALVQVLGVTLDKAIAKARGIGCQP